MDRILKTAARYRYHMLPTSNPLQGRLQRIARKYYPSSGSHGWNDHIADVYNTAVKLKGAKLSDKQFAAVVLHDIARKLMDKGHSIKGASMSSKLLSNGMFSKQDLKQIIQAIRQHSNSYRKSVGLSQPVSQTGRLLALADKGSVNPSLQAVVDRPLRFIFQGSDKIKYGAKGIPVPYNINSDADIARRVLYQIKKWNSGNTVQDNAWSRAFKKQLEQTYDNVSKATQQDILPLIGKYRKIYNTPVNNTISTQPFNRQLQSSVRKL